MPNMNWAALSRGSRQKLGAYGEYFAKMELTSYGLDVYTSEVDDRGIDFVCLNGRQLLKIQVKSVQKRTGYAFVKRRYFDITDECLYLMLLIFEQGRLPAPYLIPASAWRQENDLLKYHPYDSSGQASEPEYGINLSAKNQSLLEEYRLERVLSGLLGENLPIQPV